MPVRNGNVLNTLQLEGILTSMAKQYIVDSCKNMTTIQFFFQSILGRKCI